MPPAEPLDRILRSFATELNVIAFTVPHGHDYELLRLAGRMTAVADQHFHQRIRTDTSSKSPANPCR